MSSSPNPTRSVASAARSGIAGAIVVAIGFFDGVFLGAPIALLSASLQPSLVFAAATTSVVVLVVCCCTWVDRRWADWSAGNGRIETRLETMRTSRLMQHPVAWIEQGSDGRYALAAALANPILVAAFARSLSGEPVGERRIVLGAVAYAVPYAAMWTIIGFVLGEALRAV